MAGLVKTTFRIEEYVRGWRCPACGDVEMRLEGAVVVTPLGDGSARIEGNRLVVSASLEVEWEAYCYACGRRTPVKLKDGGDG